MLSTNLLDSSHEVGRDPNTGESIPTRNLDEGAQCGLRETGNRRQDSE